MMFRGLFSQIAVIVLAAGIVFFYIKPTLEDISKMQDDIATFETERRNVDDVNNQLSLLVSRLNSVPEEDQRKLLTYIPDQVDEIAVSRLLKIIAEQSGVLFTDVAYDGVDDKAIQSAQEAKTSDYPVPHVFQVSVEGTYQQIKNMLTMMEQNEYPLETDTLAIEVVKGSFLSAEISIVTYSHKSPAESKFNKR